MITKQRISNCLLLLVLLTIWTESSGQKIAVVENSIFHSLPVNSAVEDTSLHYELSIRELFEKKNNAWAALYKSDDGQLKKPYKTRVQYFVVDGGNKILVSGIRKLNDSSNWLSFELFKVHSPMNLELNPLPESIIQGFEYKDIISNRIVNDKTVSRKNISEFKTEYLTDSLKNEIYETLVEKYESCFQTNNTDTFLAVKKDHIHNQIKVITDGMKLGQVDIQPGNNCFTEEGRAYGGGILHYIIYPTGEIKLLVTNTALIDVADYDNDGKSEYIFFKSWFNDYGYIMYLDKFQKKVVNEWSYH